MSGTSGQVRRESISLRYCSRKQAFLSGRGFTICRKKYISQSPGSSGHDYSHTSTPACIGPTQQVWRPYHLTPGWISKQDAVYPPLQADTYGQIQYVHSNKRNIFQQNIFLLCGVMDHGFLDDACWRLRSSWVKVTGAKFLNSSIHNNIWTIQHVHNIWQGSIPWSKDDAYLRWKIP